MLQLQFYNAERAMYREKKASLEGLSSLLSITVAKHYQYLLISESTERQKLKALSKVKPSDHAIKNDLKAEYETLRKTPYNKDAESYLLSWENIGRKIAQYPIFATGEADAALDLARALAPILAMQAEIRQSTLNQRIISGENVTLSAEVVSWRGVLQTKGIKKFPTSKGASTKAAFGAACCSWAWLVT